MRKTHFIKQLSIYFDTYLPENKKCSKNTISAYADGFVLFFQFFAEKKGKAHYLIDYDDLSPQLFDEYVVWMQNEKHYSPASQKQRMSALTSFLKYASRHDIAALGAFHSATSSHTPKIPDSDFPYFSTDEIRIILKLPKCNGYSGCRDMVILSLMYDSAARAQEICDLCIKDRTIAKTSKVKLHGKGNKTREVPICQNVAKMIQKYLKERDKSFTVNKNEFLFSSQRAEKMTTACIRNLVSKYVALAKEENPTMFNEKSYSPHSFRHSKAIHMLEAGVPLIYIRNFLGHESVSTTEVYARVSQAGLTKILKEREITVPIPQPSKTKVHNDNVPDFLKKVR